LELRQVDLSKIINAAVDVVRPQAEANHIRLQVALAPEAPMIVADSERLQQIVWNLLSNAIKFTPEGGCVTVQSRRTDEVVEIVVTDTGQGIADDFLPYVFDRFRQAEGSTKRKSGGLGLGLAIVRQLVDLHKGTVSVASGGQGQGATFTVRLPATRSVGTGGLESDDRQQRAAALQGEGATVSTSAGAAEALIELDQFRPDILVADIGMPGEDGYRLIRRIRSGPLEHGRLTPAIALTSLAGDADRMRALDGGFQEQLAKPADPNVLAQTIVRLAHQHASGPE
jgi:CheY-like chemotaxis protein/anti-sigma regulatory factor (Ser/Thr protein kinase)